MTEYVIPFNQLGLSSLAKVGGKNASLGEMISNLSQAGIKVPDGFATTAEAYHEFINTSGLKAKIDGILDNLDVDNIAALQTAGQNIRNFILSSELNSEFKNAIKIAYNKLDASEVAVRSSATAEDLPDASFAGQQETYLNISGIDQVLKACKKVFASLFTDRAIAYRVHKGFSHSDIALSIGIQKMVRSDLAASGVMFTLDTESGFDKAVFITSSYGLGEMVVQGAVNPDEFYVYKPNIEQNKYAILRKNLGSKLQKMVYADNIEHSVKIIEVPAQDQNQFSISDSVITELAKAAVLIEKHYKRPMDIEWGLDGKTGEVYILQARPETVVSQNHANIIEKYKLLETGDILTTGRSIGQKIGQGKAKVLASIADLDKIKPGDVLVTDMTDPDWEPIMKRSSAIVTNRGGRTCHAAIIARELGIPAVVGCEDATYKIKNNQEVTVNCANGDEGIIYNGLLKFDINKIKLDSMPKLSVNIMMNIANPDMAFNFSSLPNKGVGLARLEFIISQMIGIHPNACLEYASNNLPQDIKSKIESKIAGYTDPKEFYIKKLAEGIATLAAAFNPEPVIIRFSDFKSNEYANLIGGSIYEPVEENPMLGFRGASRYASSKFKQCFELECEAVKFVRDTMGLTNLKVMVPFVRTIKEAKSVLDTMQEFGLERGKNGLEVIMMCELPTNALLAKEYLEYFDGFSIGSNDLTQLTLGLDRDSGLVADKFDERDLAVKKLLSMAISECNNQGKYIGICGQGPSDHPDLAKWLIEQGISSVSLNPDTVLDTWMFLSTV